MFKSAILLLCFIEVIHSFFSKSIYSQKTQKIERLPSLQSTQSSIPGLGGKIVITGIGQVDEDEFTLSLINEQSRWTSIVLGTANALATKKRFLSRTARYSGLLNILEFETIRQDENNEDYKSDMNSLLEGANSWIAFNVSTKDIPILTTLGVHAGVQRVVFTTELDTGRIDETVIPGFEDAVKAFETAGSTFTGVRHGVIIDGNENHPYELVNATIPCAEAIVQQGVLGRVVSELLLIDKSVNQVCGLSSSGSFAAAYLDILRSSGLTRQEEVTKMYTGGLQRVAKLTVAEYENQKKQADARTAIREQKKITDDASRGTKAETIASSQSILPPSTPPSTPPPISEVPPQVPPPVERERDTKKPAQVYASSSLTLSSEDERFVEHRTMEILETVWKEFDGTLKTEKSVFFDENKEMAVSLAENEMVDKLDERLEFQEEVDARKTVVNQIIDTNRRQYTKLLKAEQKNQITDIVELKSIWNKYVYLLIESTLILSDNDGKEEKTDVLDGYTLNLQLRKQANMLRQQCNLTANEAVFNSQDAQTIVNVLTGSPVGQSLGLDRTGVEVGKNLTEKHGKLLETVSALQGSVKMLALEIDTINKIAEFNPSRSEVEYSKQVSETTRRERKEQLMSKNSNPF